MFLYYGSYVPHCMLVQSGLALEPCLVGLDRGAIYDHVELGWAGELYNHVELG